MKRDAHFTFAKAVKQKGCALRIHSAEVIDPVRRCLCFVGLQKDLFEVLKDFERQVGGASFGASIQIRAVPTGFAVELQFEHEMNLSD